MIVGVLLKLSVEIPHILSNITYFMKIVENFNDCLVASYDESFNHLNKQVADVLGVHV